MGLEPAQGNKNRVSFRLRSRHPGHYEDLACHWRSRLSFLLTPPLRRAKLSRERKRAAMGLTAPQRDETGGFSTERGNSLPGARNVNVSRRFLPLES